MPPPPLPLPPPASPPPPLPSDAWASLTLDSFMLLVGLALGVFIAFVVRFWHSRIAENSQRYDELRSAILQAADISADYWLKVKTLNDRQAEARLVGLFRLINGLAIDLADELRDCHEVHAERLAEFNGLITGGPDYEVEDRPINTARALTVQQKAADLILHFQSYRRRRLTLWRSLQMAFCRSRGPQAT